VFARFVGVALCCLALTSTATATPRWVRHLPEIRRASTYGNDPKTGYRDSADNNIPALQGASNNNPGIALYRRKTLGGWYRVTAPNGRTMVVQHTDIGPSPGLAANLDVNAVAARMFGYKQGNSFPTAQGRWKIQYLGKKRPAGANQTQVQRGVGQKVLPKKQAQVAPSARQELLRSYLQQRGNPNALLSLAASVNA
jgi:hypothetical protein